MQWMQGISRCEFFEYDNKRTDDCNATTNDEDGHLKSVKKNHLINRCTQYGLIRNSDKF